MAKTNIEEAQQPLILRANRLMEAFAKSDDERDFYLDRVEGFILYVDLDRTEKELDGLEKELTTKPDRYLNIPKLTFYETKKIMEGFVNEKVYDIDTKEKLLDIIQSKEARSNFLEFIYDHHTESEKWQQYYQERSRVRIIEWLRQNHFYFVFEEDLEFARNLTEKLKQSLFETKVSRDVAAGRKLLINKAKTYYSNEALNPRPKRGRPPKQVIKQEIEPQITSDIYLTVNETVRPFLFSPENTAATGFTFSADFEIVPSVPEKRLHGLSADIEAESLQQKLLALKQLSSRWVEGDDKHEGKTKSKATAKLFIDDEDEDEEDDDFDEIPKVNKSVKPKKLTPIKAPKKKETKTASVKKMAPTPKKQVLRTGQKRRLRPAKPSPSKAATSHKPKRLRPIVKKQASLTKSKIKPKAKIVASPSKQAKKKVVAGKPKGKK